MIPADEHRVDINTTAGPTGHIRVRLTCWTCATLCRCCADPHRRPAQLHAITLGLAQKAHRQYVAATDLAQNGRSTCSP